MSFPFYPPQYRFFRVSTTTADKLFSRVLSALRSPLPPSVVRVRQLQVSPFPPAFLVLSPNAQSCIGCERSVRSIPSILGLLHQRVSNFPLSRTLAPSTIPDLLIMERPVDIFSPFSLIPWIFPPLLFLSFYPKSFPVIQTAKHFTPTLFLFDAIGRRSPPNAFAAPHLFPADLLFRDTPACEEVAAAVALRFVTSCASPRRTPCAESTTVSLPPPLLFFLNVEKSESLGCCLEEHQQLTRFPPLSPFFSNKFQ